MNKLREKFPGFMSDDSGLKVSNLMNYAYFLTPIQSELLRSEEMNRLYTLRQLSFCYVLDFKSVNMGYISATHSRLEHSIMVADYVRHFFREKLIEYDKPQEETEIAALLHDCGHTACSHAFERDTKRSQEQQVKEIIFGESKSNGEAMTVADVLEKYSIDKRRIFEIITEKNNDPETLLISQFCDRLAYIVEDAQRTHAQISLNNWSGGSLDAAKHILRDCLTIDNLTIGDKELYAELSGSVVNSHNLIEGYVSDAEWIDRVAGMCCSRTQLFMNVYGAPSNSKCVTLARNAAQIGYEEGWLNDDDLFYLNDEQLVRIFFEHKSTEEIAKQLKMRNLPDTALAIRLDEDDYKKLLEWREKRDKRIEFDEKVGGHLDINPLAKFSLPKIKYVTQNQEGKLDDLLLQTCTDVMSHKAMHDAWVTRRLVVYAKQGKEPRVVAEKAVNELGLDVSDDDFISLHGFEAQET